MTHVSRGKMAEGKAYYVADWKYQAKGLSDFIAYDSSPESQA